ncbi:MAG: hypothetical protein NZ899_02215 [Thermoguttaceae bacterium]|nr:hypothetical protein [Thermoguttaceae bacterium]MDW8078750.1 hypothetical protein [Thermoguttaceae bacterium]
MKFLSEALFSPSESKTRAITGGAMGQRILRTAFSVAAMALLFAGCQSLSPWDKPRDFPPDQAAATFRALRGSERQEAGVGVSRKAREIERDLGFK